jgi:hypothetical protein
MTGSGLMQLIESLGHWNWFIAGLLLLALELIVPGTFMLWLGLAALLVGVISLLVDWTWQWQIVAFAVFSIAAIPLWRRFARKVEPATDSPFLNQRSVGYVGRVFTLEKPIIDGSGTVRIDDSVWRVTGPDSPAGQKVKVVRADGASLHVEKAEG